MQIQTVTTFKLGNSTVVTLPKLLGIGPGTRMKVKTKRLTKKIIFEPEKETAIKKKVIQVRKLAGGFKSNLKYTPEDLNRWRDESYQ